MNQKRLLFPEVKQVEWEAFELPENPGPYEIIAKAQYSLVSVGTELALYTGTHIGFTLPNPPFPMMPQRPGYAFVGEVIAVGDEVENIEAGAKVMMEAPHGTVAVMDSRSDRWVALPDKLDSATGTLVRMADIALTSLRVAPVQLGDPVVVYGLGLVGHLAAQLYRLNGAYPVIGIDLIPNRIEVAEANGIVALNPNEVDIQQEVFRLTNGVGPQVIVEATGGPAVVSLALDLVAKGGKVALLGSSRGRVEFDVYSQVHRKGVQLVGAHESVITIDPATRRWTKPRDLALLANLFADSSLKSQGLIYHTITPGELPGIYDILAENPQDYLGVLVDWQI